jgi:hypothetical protein
MTEDDLKKIEGMLSFHFGIMSADVQKKIDLVVEGHQMLAEKLEETRIDLKADIAQLDQRVTGVAADLQAHRADTEAHHRGWQVRED